MKAQAMERGWCRSQAGNPIGAKTRWTLAWGCCVLFCAMGAFADAVSDHADVADAVVLGEEDLADRAEILRNRYRRMTPGDVPLVQDVGVWPAAWEEFSLVWNGAAAERDLGTWTVPMAAEKDGADTVILDGDGVELWRGQTDFSKDGTDGVVLTGALVAEDDWALYRAVRDEIERRAAASKWGDGGGMRGTNGPCSNGLHFVSAVGNFTTNPPELHVGLAWTNNAMVDVFAYGPLHLAETNVVTYTNDENAVVTATNVAWHAVEPTLAGYDNAWEWIGSMAVSNTGTNVFVDNGFPANRGIVRYYAAAEAVDSDGDGLNDGMEKFVWHTDPVVADTDGDGLSDGAEIAAGTDPNEPDTDGDGLPDGWEVPNGLDPLEATGADGAEGDPDGDGFANALEYELGAPANNPAWNGQELAYKLTHATPVVTTNNRSVTTNWVGLRVEVEDSWDCVDGGNHGRQDVTANLAIPDLLACGYYVEVGIAGSVEDVDSGYDKVYFNAYTDTEYFASHDGIPDSLGSEAEECRMIGEHAVKTNLVLANSAVTLRYNTVGWRWHSGGYAQIVSAREVAPYAVEVEGPDFLCVGDTAQMTASGAGGGPYVWSVVGGAASIDANGVLTALATGAVSVVASDFNSGCDGTKRVTVLDIDLGQVRERDAPCNRAPNPKQTTTNRLFVATEASGEVEIDVVVAVPPEITGRPVLCAVYEGNNHLDSASAGTDGIASFSFTPSSAVQTNSVRIGFDSNNNGLLDMSEFRQTSTTLDVVSFTHAHYTNRLDYLSTRAWQAAWGPYNVGASLLYLFWDRLADAPEPFDLTASTNVNCFGLSSLTHNAGATFTAMGDGTLDVHGWNSASEASEKISESDEMKDCINLILTNHAAEVNAFFETNPNADEHVWTWVTNNIPVNFANEDYVWHPDEYDLHVSFGNVVASYISVGVVVKKSVLNNRLFIDQLTLSGHFEDLYDFSFEREGLNNYGAVLQLGWDADNPARNAGHIFFDQVDFGHVFSGLLGGWDFDFERMNQ